MRFTEIFEVVALANIQFYRSKAKYFNIISNIIFLNKIQFCKKKS